VVESDFLDCRGRHFLEERREESREGVLSDGGRNHRLREARLGKCLGKQIRKKGRVIEAARGNSGRVEKCVIATGKKTATGYLQAWLHRPVLRCKDE